MAEAAEQPEPEQGEGEVMVEQVEAVFFTQEAAPDAEKPKEAAPQPTEEAQARPDGTDEGEAPQEEQKEKE